MEAFSFMKFWRPSGKARRDNKPSNPISGSSSLLDDPEVELREGDDSFFELELSFSDFSRIDKKNPPPAEQERHRPETTPFPVSPTDNFSKNKIIPVETAPTKPNSPIALLKSGPKFKTLSFKKSKPVEFEKSTATETMHEKKQSKSLNVRFRIEDDNEAGFSFRKTASIARSQHADDMTSEDAVSSAPSKRFFSLIKPFYAKPSKKQSNRENTNATASPASSPAMVAGKERQRSNVPGIVKRHLGKSRSASAAIGGASPVKRVDDSFLVQQDGIQSAILHCKRSFHGSRESSLLSRTTSDSSFSQEKLSSSSSEDSYVFSRIRSDSSSEKSAHSHKINLL